VYNENTPGYGTLFFTQDKNTLPSLLRKIGVMLSAAGYAFELGIKEGPSVIVCVLQSYRIKLFPALDE
jgi:hypothetical protein